MQIQPPHAGVFLDEGGPPAPRTYFDAAVTNAQAEGRS